MKPPSGLSPPSPAKQTRPSPPATATLEELLGSELGGKSIAKMSADRLAQIALRLEHGWRRWLAVEHGGRGPAEGTPDRETLERTLPVLRGLIEAKQALEQSESVLAGQVKGKMKGRHRRMRIAHTAHGVVQAQLAVLDLGVDLPYPPSPAQIEQARHLVERRYRDAGFLESGESYAWAPGAIPLVAVKDGKVVSTLSIIEDEGGLPLESVFPEAVKELRSSGHRIFEVGAFASDPETSSKLQTQATMTLVDLAVETLRRREQAHLGLLAVHPHHSGFYERRLGARRVVSEPRPHPKVQDSPAVLLSLDGDSNARAVHQEIEAVAKIVCATLD